MHLNSFKYCHTFAANWHTIIIERNYLIKIILQMKKKLLFYLLAIVMLAGISGLNAQVLKPERISKAVHFDISKKLRDVTPIQPGLRERTWKNKEVPNEFDIPDDLMNMAPLKGDDPVLQDNMRSSREGGTIDQNFSGVSNLQGVAPPDTQGDVGPDHYFQMVNSSFAIWDKTGNLLYGPADNITLWDGFPGPWSSTNDGDPVVLYDEYADRWIATQFSLPNYPSGPFYELVAVSQTGDPTGAWNRYAFQFSAMPDYPKFGVWTDGYYMSTHRFANGSWAGAGMTVFERDKMIAGDPNAQMVEFSVGSGFYGVLAADADGPTPPPAGSPNFLLDVINNALRVWEVDVDWTNTGNSTLSTVATLSTQPFSNNGLNIQQPGTGTTLDALSAMTMFRLQYRNFGSYQTLLTNHTVNGGGGKAGVRWYELRNTGSGWSIYQQGTFAPGDGDNRWMGSIAMNGNGDIALGYSVSSSSTYPSIRFVGQTSGAPLGLGVMDIDETTIYDGTKSQTGVSRWGDYSCMTVDPTDDETFWFTTEYSNGGWSWKTQIASFGFLQVPMADFSSDEILIPVGETVNFFDETSGLPSEWAWSFEGGTPASSTDENPSDIMFDTEGTFNVQLIATNVLGGDTIVKEAYITTSSTILPEVNFMADDSTICVGDTVHFTDQSVYSPNQWLWTFTPSDVTFIEGTDATSENPVVVINVSGNIDVNLEVWNLNGSSELNKTDVLVAGGLLPYYKETFENTSYEALGWEVENPDGDVTWQLYEIGGTVPGITAAGIDFRNYFAIGQRDRLISPAFNLEGYSSAALGFQHSYAQRIADGADSLIVMVSPDCGRTWSRVFADAEDGSGNFATHELNDDNFWPTEYNDWCMGGWGASCIDLDLTPWAGMPNVKVAFETYSFFGNPIMIDNVAISQYLGTEENDLSNDEIKVFPNPASTQITVVLPDNYTYSEITVMNQLGQIVKRVNVDGVSNTVNINLDSKLNAGLYFVNVVGSGKQNIQKLVVN